jgi:hypothetical protein
MWTVALLRQFIRDFFGVATSKPTSLEADTPVAALIAIATLGSYLKTARDFIVDTLGIPGAFLPALIALATFSACIVAISSKEVVNMPAGFVAQPAVAQQYSYGVWTRRFARVAFIALLFIIPHNVAATIEEVLPLPSTTVAGLIFDARTRAPAVGAKVRLVNSGDVDVTDSDVMPETDSQGVFFVLAKHRVWRSATLAVYRGGCKSTKLALWKRFQTPVPSSLTYVDVSTSPFFTFYVECPE